MSAGPEAEAVQQPEQPIPDVAQLGIYPALALYALVTSLGSRGGAATFTLPQLWPSIAPGYELRDRLMSMLCAAGLIASPTQGVGGALTSTKWPPRQERGEGIWHIRWCRTQNRALQQALEARLTNLPRDARVEKVLFEIWTDLAISECITFAHAALTTHRLPAGLAAIAEPILPSVLEKVSIGQCCALMWFAAKNAAASYLRTGGNWEEAEQEILQTIMRPLGKSPEQCQSTPQFARRRNVHECSLVGALNLAGISQSFYWTAPISLGVVANRTFASVR